LSASAPSDGGGRAGSVAALVFKSSGARMAAPASCVGRIIGRAEAEEVGLLVVGKAGSPSSGGARPAEGDMVLLINDDGRRFGVAVEGVEDVTSIAFDSIRPLPGMVVSSNEYMKFWGTALLGGEVVLLVDFCPPACG